LQITLHYVTFASDSNHEGLKNLLFSAKVSGVNVTVLGLNKPYRDYSDKTNAYYEYLQGSLPSSDVILFMDGYDVLLFPQIHTALSTYLSSSSPIVFCGERGIYPELSGSFYYPRGTYSDYSPDTASLHTSSGKFLNSGCIMGEVTALREMFEYSHRYGNIFRDDQQLFVRYLIEHPDMVSIDIHHRIFLTSFKSISASRSSSSLNMLPELLLNYQNQSIGLLHANNKDSSSSYNAVTITLRSLYDAYYRYDMMMMMMNDDNDDDDNDDGYDDDDDNDDDSTKEF